MKACIPSCMRRSDLPSACTVASKATLHAGVDYKHMRRLHTAMRLPVIGGLTQAEGDALGAYATSGKRAAHRTDVDLGSHGTLLEDGTLHAAGILGLL